MQLLWKEIKQCINVVKVIIIGNYNNSDSNRRNYLVVYDKTNY